MNYKQSSESMYADGYSTESGSSISDSTHSMHWNTIAADTVFRSEIFNIERYKRSSGSRKGTFYVLSTSNWCNIIPITNDGSVVMVEQYRHGIAGVTLEIPGGIVDPEDLNAAAAARREMLEESGYDSLHIEELGFVYPNPAIQDNRCYFFAAYEAFPAQTQCPDDLEELLVRLVPLADIPSLIQNGTISHALVVSALSKLLLKNPDTLNSIFSNNCEIV